MGRIIYADDFCPILDVVSGRYSTHTISAHALVGDVADGAGGIVACAMTSDSEEQAAFFDFGNQRSFGLNKGLLFEAIVSPAVLPTGEGELYVGVGGDWVKGPIASACPAEHMLFVLDGGADLLIYTDDTVNDAGPIDTGIDAVAGGWLSLRIDARILTDVRFFVNGLRVCGATTFNMSQVAALALQPYLGAYKASGAGLGTLYVDRLEARHD